MSKNSIIIITVTVVVIAAAGALVSKFKSRSEVASNFSMKVENGVKPPAQPGEKVPSFEGITFDGKKYQFSTLGKAQTLVVFWASWCPPCAEETPALIALAKRHRDWQIVAVTNDSTEHEIKDFLKIFPNMIQPNIAIVWDLERKLSQSYGVTGLPESFMIDQKGQLLQKFVGPVDWKKF